ncbi:MAG: capsular biosynthesis protein [Pseudomonadota bacterium]
MPATEPSRTFLLLRGPSTAFWRQLGDGLRAAGHRVEKVHLALSDALWWQRRGGVSYRGRFADWHDWLAVHVRDRGVTDILYYADRDPYHVVAKEVARELGLRSWAIENGYLRPDWLTLEPEGMGPFSQFPRDWPTIEALAADAPPLDERHLYGHSFFAEAVREVPYTLASIFGWPLYPHFMADRTYGVVAEYGTWLLEFTREGARARAAEALQSRLVEEATPFTLVAMQLQFDYQIRDCSPYDDLIEMVEEIVTSFAKAAPADHQLVFKLHPRDNVIERWPERIAAVAGAHGVATRVETIKGADLGVLARHARGVIVANSTAGLFSVRAGRPTKTLAPAVYDLPGLTHQGPLDGFWTAPRAPDPARVVQFCQALSVIQVKGEFVDPAGRAAGVAHMVERLSSAKAVQPYAVAAAVAADVAPVAPVAATG